MLQTIKLMHNIIISLFIVLILEVNTISAVDINSNVITIAATQKIISYSTEDSGTESQPLCSSLVSPLRCGQGGRGLLLPYEYCATFNEEIKLLSIFNCPYFQFDKYRHHNHNTLNSV